MLEPTTICIADHIDAAVALLQQDAGIRTGVCMRTVEVAARRDVVAHLPATEVTDAIPQSLLALRDWEARGFAPQRGPVGAPPYLRSIKRSEQEEAPVNKKVLLKGASLRTGRTTARGRSWEVTA